LSAARKARMASTFGPACRRTTNTGAGRRLLITEFKFGQECSIPLCLFGRDGSDGCPAVCVWEVLLA
jgi:hypothetical protein